MELPASYASGVQPLGLGKDAEASPVISGSVSDHGKFLSPAWQIGKEAFLWSVLGTLCWVNGHLFTFPQEAPGR